MPLNQHILIIYFQISCYKNGTSLIKIAALAKIGHETINQIYRQVIIAIQRSNL